MVFLTHVGRSKWHVLAAGVREPSGEMGVPFLNLRQVLAKRCAPECAALDRVVAHTQIFGPPFHLGKAKKLADSSFYEMRTHRGTRLFWVYGPGHAVILLNGFQKKGWRIPARELERAEAWASALAHVDHINLLASAAL